MRARKVRELKRDALRCLAVVLGCCVVGITTVMLIGCGDTTNPAHSVSVSSVQEPVRWSVAEVNDEFSLYANPEEGAVYVLSRDGDHADFSVRIGTPLEDVYDYGFPEHIETFVDVSGPVSGFGESVAFAYLGDVRHLFLFVGAPGNGGVFVFTYHSRAGWMEIETARIEEGVGTGKHIEINYKGDGIVVDGKNFSFADFLFTAASQQEMEVKID